MNISIISLGGIDNFGERAILFGTIIELRKKYPSAKIAIHGYKNLKEKDHHLYNKLRENSICICESIINSKSLCSKICSIFSLFLKIRPRHLILEEYEYLKKADAIYSKGKESFTNSYGFKFFVDSFLGFYLVSRLNKNVILYGHSIGPFDTRLERFIVKHVCKKVKKIYVRDSESLKELKKIKSDERVELIKDFAFKAVEAISTELCVEKKKQAIVVPNAALLKKRYKDKTIYLENVGIIIKKLIDSERKVILLSSVIANDWNDDYQLCYYFKNKYPEVELRKHLSLVELLMDIKESEIIISSRLHPLILGYGLSVKLVALNANLKVKGIMKDLHLEKNIIDPFIKDNLQKFELI